ncbi:diadenylate cyclase [Pseudofulvibacter geojedonensis]|uniref:Diadenylate cyclase n=1 Tax=Pseudofulvibacter geojedonensis TaxID=1123758 RepID=A0ABW3HZQ1_9FLAO
MELFDFLEFDFLDLIDITLVAFLLYYVYRLIRGTVAINIFIGIIIVYLIWELTKALNMDVLSSILGKFISVGVFALIVVFQQEIRKFLLMIGSTKFFTNNKLFQNLSFLQEELKTTTNVDATLNACHKLAASKTGVLLVFRRKNNLDFVKTTGDEMNINITQPILESIFYKNSPLHDGAAIVEGNNITATRVILPVSNEKNIPSRFGLRHRAAIGITEKTDAIALVVSEETGELSYIKNGEFILFQNTEELSKMLREDLN